MRCRLNMMVLLWMVCGGAILLFQLFIGTSLLQFGETQVVEQKTNFAEAKERTKHVKVSREDSLDCPACPKCVHDCPKCPSCPVDLPGIRDFLEEHVSHTNRNPLIIAITRGVKRIPSFYMSLHPPDKDQAASKVILSTGFWEGEKVSKLLMYMEKAPDDYYFVETGAHIGFMALSMVASGYKTIAIEPLTHNYALLKESIFLNKMDEKSIDTFNIALGNETSQYCMSVGTANQAMARIEAGTFNLDCDVTRHKVDMKRLDDVIPDKKIWLLNVDVELYAPLIIYGAKNILEGKHPPKYIHFVVMKYTTQKEVGVDLKQFFSWLQKVGYKLTDSHVGTLSDVDNYIETSVGGLPSYVMAEYVTDTV